ncbi:MAG: hypothetical protein IKL84_07490, partial [Clostridia bacterium]|nr:hypothetical protein [Clostridia bacterium]
MYHTSKWIWLDREVTRDQYGEFYDTFTYTGGNIKLQISADSNYAVYLNGKPVDSGQYPDFPHYKVYDELDLTSAAVPGQNHLAIVVWYYGETNMTYYRGNAALRYALEIDGKPVCVSSRETLSRLSQTFQNNYRKIITGQLGYSFHYDLTREDGWMLGALNGFSASRIVEQDLPMYRRPIPKFSIGDPAESFCLLGEGNRYLYDLGRESCGYLFCRLRSDRPQKLVIAYGEHIVDGGVRRKVGHRDFSVELTVRAGENEYFNPFRRLGLRYLEVFSEAPIEIELMTVRPTDYPLNHIGRAPEDPLRRRIYDTSVRTLALCMHDHYEDTPWREQALYAMDSRNQMLCGYYVFGEYAFPRASLLLMSHDRRADGLLTICAPTDRDLAIPSFSLHYVTEVYEYTLYSGDRTLIEEIFPRLETLIHAFASRIEESGLIPIWTGKSYWNFYEWSNGLSSNIGRDDGKKYDAALHFMLIFALQNMQKIADLLNIERDYLTLAARVTQAANAAFFDAESGLYVNSTTDFRHSELVNAFAILSGAASGERADAIAEKLAEGAGMTPATLSMVGFKYDALLQIDRERYRDVILADIDRKYSAMLEAGATSFWETELGERDFDYAG